MPTPVPVTGPAYIGMQPAQSPTGLGSEEPHAWGLINALQILFVALWRSTTNPIRMNTVKNRNLFCKSNRQWSISWGFICLEKSIHLFHFCRIVPIGTKFLVGIFFFSFSALTMSFSCFLYLNGWKVNYIFASLKIYFFLLSVLSFSLVFSGLTTYHIS